MAWKISAYKSQFAELIADLFPLLYVLNTLKLSVMNSTVESFDRCLMSRTNANNSPRPTDCVVPGRLDDRPKLVTPNCLQKTKAQATLQIALYDVHSPPDASP